MCRLTFIAIFSVMFTVTPYAVEVKKQTPVAEAVTAPLSDLNLIHSEIPPALIIAQKQPYKVPSELSCGALLIEVEELDALLGPDIDSTELDTNTSLIKKGVSKAKSTAVGTLRNTTESVIPYRGWVRKLSGAERYSKKVTASITAGTIRRAFLKGIMVSKECEQSVDN